MLISEKNYLLTCKDRNKFALLFCMLICLICLSATAFSEETHLQIKPANCVALREGQICYQTLTINWQAAAIDNYCLHQRGDNTPLICWNNLIQGSSVYEFAGNSSTDFILVRQRDNQTIAKFTLEVAWVYDANSHRESHWRIF